METYSENSRLQPNTAAVQMNADNVSESVYSKQYGYTASCQSANNGNILNIVDPLNNNRSQGFCYDSLNRISAFANGDGSMQVAYAIDPFGNMTQSGTETLQVGYNSANNRITSSGFSYDAAGNMTQSDFGFPATFAYDALGQITNYDNGGATYTYDGGGNRVRKDVSGAWTEYVYFDQQPMAEKNSDGSWSDYIFANGQRIAEADSYDERIHTHGTSSGTGEYASWHLPWNGYVVKSGDKISWRQYQAGGGKGGVLLGFTDNTTANWNTYDQNGQIINSATTQGQWMQRTVDLTPFAGKTMRTVGVVTDAQTGASTWDVYYADMAITSTDGTVTPIYDRESAVSLSYYSSTVISNEVAQAERSNTAIDAEQPGNSTTYYVGDQIGSERMLMAAGGWPLSMDTYYPYGTEATPSAGANHYKFTGKERDTESGLDYFGARYYGSSMGRFSSADDGEDQDVQNPQSWKLYSYVQNNPLTNTDPDGHDCINTSNLQQDGTVTVTTGTSCASDPGKYGTYVDGTVDTKSLTTDGHGSLGYSYSNYADGSGSAGGGVISPSVPYGPLEGPANLAGANMIGNGGMSAIKDFAIGSVVGGAIGGAALTAAGTEAGLSILTENLEGVLSRAGSSMGNQGAKVASREVAEAAAKKWVGEGARPLVDRGTGKVIGEISADGTKIARFTSAETKGYINLVNKLTGSNLHVGW